MKEMKTDEVKKAMIEIILGNKPSILKIKYPEHYKKLQKEIIDFQSSGKWVKIPV